MKSRYIIILVTCGSKKEALLIAKKLLNERLIACANIIDNIESFFWWKEKLDKARESLIIIKTVKKNFNKIERRIKQLHAYELPEIIALPLVKGEGDYLKWIDKYIKT